MYYLYDLLMLTTISSTLYFHLQKACPTRCMPNVVLCRIALISYDNMPVYKH